MRNRYITYAELQTAIGALELKPNEQITSIALAGVQGTGILHIERNGSDIYLRETIAIEDAAEPDITSERIDAFGRIQDEKKFQSVWSMLEVEDIHAESGLRGSSFVYENVQLPLPDKSLTWMELWEIAETAILRSGDLHHIFIENIYRQDGMLWLNTGS